MIDIEEIARLVRTGDVRARLKYDPRVEQYFVQVQSDIKSEELSEALSANRFELAKRIFINDVSVCLDPLTHQGGYVHIPDAQVPYTMCSACERLRMPKKQP